MRFGLLGTGCWGFCLASILASKGHDVISWTTNDELAKRLNETREHPKLVGYHCSKENRFTTDMAEVLKHAEILVESVTSAGVRPVFEKVKKIGIKPLPIVITSKGIEQKTGLILCNVIEQVLGEEFQPLIGYLSGPSYAEELIKGSPTGVVASAYNPEVMKLICDAFTTLTLRVYPNADVVGVALGGALKNIIAIACGIADGLGLGYSARASIITRGLHEIRKLAVAKGCKSETLNGLSGMGDLVVTCSSTLSRNFRFGHLLAKGLSQQEAHDQIGMVIEGAYTCVSAREIGRQLDIEMPITESVYRVLYEGVTIREALSVLLQRTIKEEHL